MHRFQNLSYKEAAELLNVSPKTVDYRIQQALKIFKGQAERLSATDIDAPAHLALRPYTSRTSPIPCRLHTGTSTLKSIGLRGQNIRMFYPNTWGCFTPIHGDVFTQNTRMYYPKTPGCIALKHPGVLMERMRML